MRTLQGPAHDTMLKLISCGCTGDCSSARCSCKTVGLKCSSICKNCHRTKCLNHSYEEQFIPELDVLQDFESEGIEDENIENENEGNNFVNEDDFLEVSI